ncbi:MAG: transposase [Chloroflexi bacterium]|nr:transposase [Chloroflexota bacterium]
MFFAVFGGVVQHFSISTHPIAVSDAEVADQLRISVEQQPRWGFKKLYHALRHGGYNWNHKRVHRVYRALQLHLRGKRLPKHMPLPLAQPEQPNECWL